ncbi:MAG: HEAT repeat domain-containing protein [Myxococcaceae bacterium]
MNMPVSLRLGRSLFFVTLSLLGGCRGSAWTRAAEIDTPAAYRAFLRESPSGEEAEEAVDRLAELEFTEAAKLHTVVAYRRFLEEFPKSRQAAQAEARLEALRFNAAKDANTLGAWRNFLSQHPSGAHRTEALDHLSASEDVALASASPDETRTILARRGQTVPVAVTEKLDGQAFAAAERDGTTALLRYLQQFPTGAHREAAKRAILRRRLWGLLFSEMLEAAQTEASDSPLVAGIADWPTRLAEAERRVRALERTPPAARASQVDYYLRSLPDLDRAMHASDALHRWEAAQEAGLHVSVGGIDSLARVIREDRNPKVRLAAFQSLRQVLRALPPDFAEHELAHRLAAKANVVSAGEQGVLRAVFLELSGRLADAASEYQRAFDAVRPDPLVLWRWIELRREMGQPFSAALAARQLSHWANRQAEWAAGEEGGSGVGPARQLCAAVGFARVAEQVLRELAPHEKDFPKDAAAFLALAERYRVATEARLSEGELKLRKELPQAGLCADEALTLRLADAEKQRAARLGQLRKNAPQQAPWLLARARERDPSPYIRSLAEKLLASPR